MSIVRGTHVTMVDRDGTNLATGEYLHFVPGSRFEFEAHVVRTDAGYHSPREVRYVPAKDVARIYSQGHQIA